MQNTTVHFQNAMSSGSYERSCSPGDLSDHPEFRPHLSPREMLIAGVFEGRYLNSCRDEYPEEWFIGARLSDVPDPRLNKFGLKSRTTKSWWHERNLIDPQDPRGWFEWYCRFWMGRRSTDDARQIRRWRGMVRHSAQVEKNGRGDVLHRRRQRQTLLQWSYNPTPDLPKETQ